MVALQGHWRDPPLPWPYNPTIQFVGPFLVVHLRGSIGFAVPFIGLKFVPPQPTLLRHTHAHTQERACKHCLPLDFRFPLSTISGRGCISYFAPVRTIVIDISDWTEKWLITFFPQKLRQISHKKCIIKTKKIQLKGNISNGTYLLHCIPGFHVHDKHSNKLYFKNCPIQMVRAYTNI